MLINQIGGTYVIVVLADKDVLFQNSVIMRT